MKKTVLAGLVAVLVSLCALPSVAKIYDKDGNVIPPKTIEGKVNALESDMENVAKNLANRVPMNYVHIAPTDSGFFVLTDAVGYIALTVVDLKPYGNGTQLDLSVVNLLGVTLNDVKLTIFYFEKSPEKSKNKKVIDSHIFVDKVNISIPTVDGGSEHLAHVRIPNIAPSKLSLFQVFYDSTGGIEFKKAKN